MLDRICPFSATLIRDQFACRNASRIIRRGGMEIACTAADAHERCGMLYRHLKAVALPEFGVGDDLLLVSHGILQKIQFGGLSGLQRITTGTSAGEVPVVDIDSLVQAAIKRFSSLEQIPYTEVSPDITAWELQRRRGRRT